MAKKKIFDSKWEEFVKIVRPCVVESLHEQYLLQYRERYYSKHSEYPPDERINILIHSFIENGTLAKDADDLLESLKRELIGDVQKKNFLSIAINSIICLPLVRLLASLILGAISSYSEIPFFVYDPFNQSDIVLNLIMLLLILIYYVLQLINKR